MRLQNCSGPFSTKWKMLKTHLSLRFDDSNIYTRLLSTLPLRLSDSIYPKRHESLDCVLTAFLCSTFPSRTSDKAQTPRELSTARDRVITRVM